MWICFSVPPNNQQMVAVAVVFTLLRGKQVKGSELLGEIAEFMTTPNLNEMIWLTVASIPTGQVASYGQVARLTGAPNHARYVGRTLKQLPSETTLPWHRVVNSAGKIAFPKDSKAYSEQRQRLLGEGVLFKGEKIGSEFFWSS